MRPYGEVAHNAMLRAPVAVGGYSPNPEIIDRASLLPIGQYEDGSLTLAWPGFLKDAWDGGIKSLVGQEGAPLFDDGGQYVSGSSYTPADVINFASAGPIAGVAGRAAGLVENAARPALSAPTLPQRGMRLLADEPDLSLPSLAPFDGRRLAYDIANGAGDDAGRVEMTLGPDGQAYIEHVVFGESISNGTKGAREFLRLIKQQHPEVRSIFGDRVSGAHAVSGQPRQAVDTSRLAANETNASLPSLLGAEQDDNDPMSILQRYGLLEPPAEDVPRPPVIGPGRPDPFDRYNDPFFEVPEIINNPFSEPPRPPLPRLRRPLPFRLGPPTG